MCAWSCKGTGRFQNNHLSSREQSARRMFFNVETSETLAAICGHVYIINAHVCRCGHTGTRDRVQPLQTEPCEICFSNHLGFEQLSSDERASFVSKTEICSTWAEIPCSLSSAGWCNHWYCIPYVCFCIFVCCGMHQLHIFSTKIRIIFLCWAQVSLYTYMSSFLQITSLHKDVVHSKCCRRLGDEPIGSTKSLISSKST